MVIKLWSRVPELGIVIRATPAVSAPARAQQSPQPFDRTNSDRVDHQLDVADALGGELRHLLAELLRQDRLDSLLGPSATRHLAATALHQDADGSLERAGAPTAPLAAGAP